jgi:hypothetical protein
MILLAGMLAVPCAWALTDYSTMTDEQLYQQRATIRNTAPEEQQAFTEEWYRRCQMRSTPTERQEALRNLREYDNFGGYLQIYYRHLSDHQLRDMRAVIDKGTGEQKWAFWSEWQRRGLPMTAEEKVKCDEYRSRYENPGHAR